MDFASASASWDPLGDPVPVAEMGGLLGDAERAAPPPGSPPPANRSWIFFVPAAGLFLFAGFVRELLAAAMGLSTAAAGKSMLLQLSPWLVAIVLFIIGLGFSSSEAREREAAVHLEKLRYAKRKGWTMSFGNRVKKFQTAFPAFMRCAGSSPAIGEEWWGNWTADGRQFQVWIGQLEYLVSAGKHSETEYSPMIGVRVRSPAPAQVTLTPEDLGTKFVHLFKSEYKVGNAEFDAAFNVVADAALQSSSALPSVLNPPFVAAAMRCRAGRPMWLVRDRDLLLVRFKGAALLMPPDDSPAVMAAGGAVALEDAALDMALKALVEPVVALAVEAGL